MATARKPTRAQELAARREWLEDFEARELTPTELDAARRASEGFAATKAAPGGAKDRTAGKRPAGGRRSTSGRRLAKRVARETPGIPGPSATNLVLAFLGTTVLVIGLTLLLSPASGRSLESLPAWLGAGARRFLDPDDPIF